MLFAPPQTQQKNQNFKTLRCLPTKWWAQQKNTCMHRKYDKKNVGNHKPQNGFDRNSSWLCQFGVLIRRCNGEQCFVYAVVLYFKFRNYFRCCWNIVWLDCCRCSYYFFVCIIYYIREGLNLQALIHVHHAYTAKTACSRCNSFTNSLLLKVRFVCLNAGSIVLWMFTTTGSEEVLQIVDRMSYKWLNAKLTLSTILTQNNIHWMHNIEHTAIVYAWIVCNKHKERTNKIFAKVPTTDLTHAYCYCHILLRLLLKQPTPSK